MPHTKWKQDFYGKVPPITMREPLGETLGALDDGEPVHYHYTDCVKLAGHACASVTSAFHITRLALSALYGDKTPVRGEIDVRFAGDRTSGANGPIGQVIGFITGAAVETGFHGLGGKYRRADRFVYDETMDKNGAQIAVCFKRVDTGQTVTVYASPSLVPLTDGDRANGELAPKVIHGSATAQEREKFFSYWQGLNRKILMDDNPSAFRVQPADAPAST